MDLVCTIYSCHACSSGVFNFSVQSTMLAVLQGASCRNAVTEILCVCKLGLLCSTQGFAMQVCLD